MISNAIRDLIIKVYIKDVIDIYIYCVKAAQPIIHPLGSSAGFDVFYVQLADVSKLYIRDFYTKMVLCAFC